MTRGSSARLVRPARGAIALAAALLPAALLAQEARPAEPAPAASAAQAQADAAGALPRVSVRGTKLKTLDTHVGKSATPIKDTPQSVTLITAERIEQQSLKTLDDVLLQATGVTREQLWLNNNYYARGLQIKNIRYDGGATSLITDRNNNADLAQFEEVAILRGADGLFGAGDAGGVINMRSKRPKDQFSATAQLSAASWNNLRAELDVSSPLTEDGRIKARGVAVLQDRDHFFKPSHSSREMVYGAVQVDPMPGTSFLAGASFQQDRQDAFNASLPRYEDGADAQLPRSTTMGAPWGWLDRANTTFFASLTQKLGPQWTLNANLRHMRGQDKINGAEMEGAISYTTKTSDWWRYQDQTGGKETLMDLNLQGSFAAFGRLHDVVLGVDRSESSKDYRQNWVYYAAGNAFDRVAPPAWAYPPASWDTDTRHESAATAAYGSLRLRPLDDLAVTVGGRKVLRDTQSILNRNTGKFDPFSQKNDLVPFAAAVYALSPDWSVYASRAEIYQSQMNYYASESGPSLEPATGTNNEVGIKGELFQRRLLATLALFDIKKEKEAVSLDWRPLPGNAWCCYAATGYKSVRGVDLELNGQVMPGWDLALGYTYNQNKNLRDNDARFSTLTPRHLLKLWSNHKLNGLSPRLRGLSLGWGVNAQSASSQSGWVQAYNPATGLFDGAYQTYSFVQGGYAVWSARAAYEFNPRWSLALNLNNLFDRRYFSTVGTSGYGNFYGDPRNFVLTLKASY